MTDKNVLPQLAAGQPVFVAVYGTLLSPFHNHRLLADSRLVGNGTSDFWGTMYSNGGFPILSLLDATSKIQVEVYAVTSAEVMEDLDCLEGFPGWYDRSVRTFDINGEKIKAWIYHQDKELTLPVVESGDWKEFKKGDAY